jgi:hypothetical protein
MAPFAHFLFHAREKLIAAKAGGAFPSGPKKCTNQAPRTAGAAIAPTPIITFLITLPRFMFSHDSRPYRLDPPGILGHLLIILAIVICNRPLGIRRWLLIGSKVLEGLAFGESPWRRWMHSSRSSLRRSETRPRSPLGRQNFTPSARR